MNNSELLEIAEEYGTPTFVFDVREFWQRLDKIADIFGEDVRLCFAMKANPFLAAAAADHGERLERNPSAQAGRVNAASMAASASFLLRSIGEEERCSCFLRIIRR